jgi:hypothetical protein
MAWWSGTNDPTRKNRFLVEFGNGSILQSVSSVTKPSVTIEKKEYRMINHFYNYPGIPKWEPVTIKFVDNKMWGENRPETSTAHVLYEMLVASGYVDPEKSTTFQKTVPVVGTSKAAMMDNSFGDIKIYQLDHEGGTKLENWELKNPIITKISWGELDYGDDGLVEYTLDISYDYAVYSSR